MELWQLRYFVAVGEEEHVGRAAERLHVSQSPLSRQIRQLEEQLGVALFVREGRRLRLTALGREALARARHLLRSADALRSHLQSAGRGDAGPVAIGYVQGASYNGVLPRALARLRQHFPGIEPRLHPLGSRQQVAALRDSRIDLGFAHGDAAGEPGIQSRRLVLEPFMVALPVGDVGDELCSDALAELPWITLPRATHPRFHEAFTRAARAIGFTPHIAMEAVDVPAALSFVAADLGAALIQESIGRSLPEGVMARKAPTLAMEIQTHVLWRPDTLSSTARNLLECVDTGDMSPR